MTDTDTPLQPSAPPPPPPPEEAPDRWVPPRRHPLVWAGVIIAATVVVLAILAAWLIWPFGAGGPSTENAYVQGRTTILSPQVNGTIETTPVRDYANVRRGQLIFQIDRTSYLAKLRQAEAELDLRRAALANNRQDQAAARAQLDGKRAAEGSARAQNERSAIDYRRSEALVGDGSVSRRERDQALATYRQAAAALRQAQADVAISYQNLRSTQVQREGLVAQVEAAAAQVSAAKVDLNRTRIVAPVDGTLGEIKARQGQFVSAGAQLVSLVPPARWVIANFKETQTHGIQLGQPATISVDALGGARFDAFVERIAPATGSEFAVVKPDNATGNFVKVPQRIGVRLAIRANQPGAERIRPGMSVEAWINTSAR